MNKEVNLSKLFLVFSLLFGVLFVLLVPPFNSPDESTHFMYAYEISEGNFLPVENKKKSGYYIPKSIINLKEKSKRIINNRDEKYSYSEMYLDNLLSSSYKDREFMSLNVQTQPIIAYLAPAIGIEIATHLKAFSDQKDVSPIVLLQFARFFSLLFYTILCYLAIKITPKFKKTMFVVLLLPFAVILRGMVTYDSFVLAISAITLANIIRLIDSKHSKFSKKDLLFFIITGFILLNVKTVYFVILFGLLAIPNDVFNGKKEKWKNFIIMGFIILLISFIRKLLYVNILTIDNPDFKEQIDFIISNPFSYFKILVRNIIEQLRIQNWWLLGTYGCLDTYTPVLVQFLLKIYLIIILLLDSFYEKIIIPFHIKIGYLICVVLSVFAMYTYMYIYWTPIAIHKVGGTEITGIQGRYYMPLLLLLPIIFNNGIIYNLVKNIKIKKIMKLIYSYINNYFHLFTLFSLIFTVIIIILRYYV